MRNKEFNKTQVVKYMIWTFGLAYVIQFCTTGSMKEVGASGYRRSFTGHSMRRLLFL